MVQPRFGNGVLGLSLGKILFTVLVIVVVWKAFSMLSRLQQTRRGEVRDEARRPARRRAGRTVELVECPHCGAFHDPTTGCACRRAGGGRA